jgi:hypothetical protein
MRVLHHHRAQILNVNSTSWHSQYTKWVDIEFASPCTTGHSQYTK